MKKEVKRFFQAKSFAVIGASRDENKVGHVVFKNLLEQKIKAYPVNIKAEKILGQTCYPDVLEIPYDIDCAIICTPAKTIPEILMHVKNKKIKNLIVMSAGFAETGDKNLERRIKDFTEKNDLQVLGPNCFGIVDSQKSLNTTFYSGEIKKGEIGFISQSGAIASSVFDMKKGISKFVSLGNKMQLSFSDFIDFLDKDEQTKIICIYMEALNENEGRDFIEISKKCKKPIVVLKSGKTERAKEIARSHTAALASEERLYTMAFKQAGIMEVSSIEEMFSVVDVLKTLNYKKIGNKACIITNAGGFGVLTTDYCADNKIELPEISAKAKERLKTFLPHNASLKNPIDIIGDADSERYKQTLETLKDENFDFFIVILTPQEQAEAERTARYLLEIKQRMNKPIFACFIGDEEVSSALKLFKDKIPNFLEPQRLCEVLGKIFE